MPTRLVQATAPLSERGEFGMEEHPDHRNHDAHERGESRAEHLSQRGRDEHAEMAPAKGHRIHIYRFRIHRTAVCRIAGGSARGDSRRLRRAGFRTLRFRKSQARRHGAPSPEANSGFMSRIHVGMREEEIPQNPRRVCVRSAPRRKTKPENKIPPSICKNG